MLKLFCCVIRYWALLILSDDAVIQCDLQAPTDSLRTIFFSFRYATVSAHAASASLNCMNHSLRVDIALRSSLERNLQDPHYSSLQWRGRRNLNSLFSGQLHVEVYWSRDVTSFFSRKEKEVKNSVSFESEVGAFRRTARHVCPALCRVKPFFSFFTLLRRA